jgi:hypothetical protein
VDTIPLGSELELIAKGVAAVEVPAAATVIFREAEAVCPSASVTPKVRALVPAFVGVPDNTPAELKPRPVLQAPEHFVTAQV